MSDEQRLSSEQEDQMCDIDRIYVEPVDLRIEAVGPEWAGEDVPAQSRWIPVCSPKPRCPVRGRFVNPYAVAAWVHWDGERTVPHMVGSLPCRLCMAGQRKMWKAWLPFEFYGSTKLGILEITSEAGRQHPQLVKKSADWRGVKFIARRMGEHRQSRMDLEFPGVPDLANLPAPVDTVSALMALWGLAHLEGQI